MTTWEGSTTSSPRTGTTVDVLGMTMSFRLNGAETAGKFSITDSYVLPGAGPVFLHTHPAEETFIILEGQFEVYGRVDGTKVSQTVGPGHIHHVSSNAPHGIKNSGSTMGRMLLLFHPADLQESLFRDIGKSTSPTAMPMPLTKPSPEDVARLMKAFEKHRMKLLEEPHF